MAIKLSELKAQGANVSPSQPRSQVRLSDVKVQGGAVAQVDLKGQSEKAAQMALVMDNIKRQEAAQRLNVMQGTAPGDQEAFYENVRKNLKDPRIPYEEALNPYVRSYEDTQEYLFRDSTPEEREKVKGVVSKRLTAQGFDPLTGEQKEFWNPRVGGASAEKLIEKEKLRLRNPYMLQQAEETSALESAAIGIGRGMYTVGRGLGLVDMPDEAEEAGYQALKREGWAMPGAEVLGEVAPFAPAGVGISALRSTGGRIAAGTALGATEGGVVAKGLGADDEGVMYSALIGGAIGGTFEGLVPAVNLVARRMAAKSEVDVPLERLSGNNRVGLISYY